MRIYAYVQCARFSARLEGEKYTRAGRTGGEEEGEEEGPAARRVAHFKMPRCAAWLALTFTALLITGGRCLKNVRLEVIPEAVEHGHEATLRCYYELEDIPLYSLKWYRGTFEFYRVSPNEKPQTQIFHSPWIKVDRNNSNQSQVTIQNVDYPLSGNFSCEVTTDAPTFSTASSSKTLTVISIPKGKPVIVSERGRYEPGETLKANCSMPSSTPLAQLTFTINDLQVGSGDTKQTQPKPRRILKTVSSPDEHQQQLDSERQWTELSLHLLPRHFLNGQLTLRCTGKVDGFYDQWSEVQLGTGVREPVPERVTFESAAANDCRTIADLGIVLGLILPHLLLR